MKFISPFFLCFFIFGAYAQEVPLNDIQPAVEPVATETITPLEAKTLTVEPEIIYVEEKLFSPEFMKNLLACKPDSESEEEQKIEILGQENEICHLKYANFDLNVPLTLIGNIHGFDDVETLLKNKDIAHYNYRADYIYDGLMYAINACLNKKGYEGKQEELADEYVVINRGLNSEFVSGICTIYLSNTQSIEGIMTDYSVICKLPYKTVQELEPYFKDLVEKYGEKRGFADDGHIMVTREQKNKQTREADIALMYYLQKNGYCKKNGE